MGLRFEPMTLSSEDLRTLRIEQTEQSPMFSFLMKCIDGLVIFVHWQDKSMPKGLTGK
jgi:hypothetical protein